MLVPEYFYVKPNNLNNGLLKENILRKTNVKEKKNPNVIRIPVLKSFKEEINVTFSLVELLYHIKKAIYNQ